MNHNLPLVSVVIPTYNRADYLELTLNSVIGQTYQNIEVLVVDDGSSNNLTRDLCSKYNKVKYIRIENSGGPAKPRNVGIEQSTGEYVAFVDDDDIWNLDKLEKQVEILNANEDFGLVHSYCELIDEHGGKIEGVIGRPRHTFDKHGDVLKRMFGSWTVMMPTPMIRIELIKKVGGFNERIPPGLEDVEYWSRCAFYTKFYYLDEPLVLYRKHSGNISQNNKFYVDLPIYLNSVLIKETVNKEIKTNEVTFLNLKLLQMQAKNINTYFIRTIINLFKLNYFWFLNFRVLKTIVKRLISA